MLDVMNCKKVAVIEFFQFQIVKIFEIRLLKVVLSSVSSRHTLTKIDKLTPDSINQHCEFTECQRSIPFQHEEN